MNGQYKEGFFAEIKGFIEKHVNNKLAAIVLFVGDEHGFVITPKDVASIRMDEEFIIMTWSDKHMRKGSESRVRFDAITRVEFNPVPQP